MAHRNARLTLFGRQMLVDRVERLGWSPSAVADAAGVSRATVYKWLRRFREEGPAGLEDRSSRPRRCPTALPARSVQRILGARRRAKVGPHQLAGMLGIPRSTIYGVLCRHGLSRLSHIDRPTGIPIRRYWRLRGREAVPHHHTTKTGYDYIHSAVDDNTRIAFSQIRADETGDSCAEFLLATAKAFADIGITIERVMTDEAKNYTVSKAFKSACSHLVIRHVTTGPYRPRINGKVERFNRTLAEEWAYKRLYRSNSHRQTVFNQWLWNYNHNRPHTALNGRSPMDSLFNKVHGNYS